MGEAEIPRGTANTWLLPRVRKWLPYLDAHRNDVSLRGLRPWTNGDDRPFVYLRHRGIREDDSAYRFLHGGDALHQDPVKEGHQTLQTAGHVSPSLSLSRSVSLCLAFARFRRQTYGFPM